MQQRDDGTFGGGTNHPDLLGALWGGRLLIAVSVLGALIAAALYATVAERWYRAEVVMVRNDSKELPSSLSQFGGIAALAGINLGSADDLTPLAVLRSREFCRQFLVEKGLVPTILSKTVDSVFGLLTSGQAPDVRDAVKYFQDNLLDVAEDKKNGVVTISVEWTDAAAAAEWANILAARLNSTMREAAERSAQRNIDYLQHELVDTSITTMQQSIGRLLETEMQKFMLARGNSEFAFRIIDPATPPKKSVRPRKLVALVAAGLLALVVSASVTFMLAALKGRRTRTGGVG